MPNSNSICLVERLLAGDQEAARLIFMRYFDRMSRLARRRMSQKIQSRCDAQDVAQSALSTFFELALKNRYSMERDCDLWRLLSAITIHKANQTIQFHRRGKRSVDKESSGQYSPGLPIPLDLPSRSIPVESALATAEELESLVQILEPCEWQALQLRLQDQSTNEIAQILECSTRTIRRIFSKIQAKLQAVHAQLNIK